MCCDGCTPHEAASERGQDLQVHGLIGADLELDPNSVVLVEPELGYQGVGRIEATQAMGAKIPGLLVVVADAAPFAVAAAINRIREESLLTLELDDGPFVATGCPADLDTRKCDIDHLLGLRATCTLVTSRHRTSF